MPHSLRFDPICHQTLAMNLIRVRFVRLNTSQLSQSVYLDESKYFFLNDGWGIGLRGDDLDQHAVDEVPGGHVHVEPVAAVLHARL